MCRDGSLDIEENHTVVATARGVYDSNGGVLESKDTGVCIIIPKGAIPESVQQEIYFKVCQDNSILPPLDKEKGKICFNRAGLSTVLTIVTLHCCVSLHRLLFC